MSNLTQKHCKPCEGGTPPLTDEAARAFLSQLSSEWQMAEGHKIQREFKFKNFREAMAFLNRVAEVAETEGHHPDINLHGWNKVTIALSTHSIVGLSENDFIMAGKIEQL